MFMLRLFRTPRFGQSWNVLREQRRSSKVRTRHSGRQPLKAFRRPTLLRPSGLAEVARSVLPTGTAVESASVSACEDGLATDEVPFAARFVAKRTREFAAGRVCARKALAELGVTPQAVPRGEIGEPVWPPGIVGSITHDRDYCVAAVHRARRLAGLGIDVASDEPLDHRLIDLVCSAAERDELAADADREDHAGKLLFSLKESIYKCLFPITRRRLDFRDLSIVLDHAVGAAMIVSLGDLRSGHAGEAVIARYAIVPPCVFTAAWIPRYVAR
jgi:4'-phosphopantetheinyl transferase EntD